MPLAASYVRLLISKADFAKAGATAPIGQAATPPKPRRRGGLVAHCCGICDGSSMRAIRSADFTARAVFLAVENRGAVLAAKNGARSETFISPRLTGSMGANKRREGGVNQE